MTLIPTTRMRRKRIVWGDDAGGALAELLLLAAWIAAVGWAPVPLPAWIALVALGALLGHLVTAALTAGAGRRA